LPHAEWVFVVVDLGEPGAAEVVVGSSALGYGAGEVGVVGVGGADGVVASCG